MSVEEYLRTEETSPVKREYVNGFVYPLHAQAGTTSAHALITGNVFVAVRQAARCQGRQSLAPRLLVEVLSRSTAHNDHNAKYHAYTALPSLQAYLLVEQGERRVYVYTRKEGGWQMQEYAAHDTIPLPFLDASLALDDIYQDVL